MAEENLAQLSDDDLRITYLRLANSDDAWFSGKAARAEKYLEELRKRKVELYPKEAI